MNKKNLIVLNSKNCFLNIEQISTLYSNFKKKILKLKNNKFLVAVSGGPDSLALAAMCKAFHTHNKKKVFYYVHINHGIRKNSLAESKRVKKILKQQGISLKIIKNESFLCLK